MSRKEDILTALQSLKDEDLRTAGAALFDALGYRSTRTFEDLPTDPTSFWDFFSQGHSDLDPGKAEIEHWRGATFLFQLTDAEVHDLAKAREATKEQGDYEESEIESFLFLAIDLEGEQWTRTRLAQITRTLNRLFLMPAIVLFRHGGLASLAVIDRRQSKVDAAKDVILAKKIAIVKDIRLAKPHRAHIDILEKLTFANLNRGRNITTFRGLYDAWLSACSVETLTKEFFTKLSELFFDTSDSLATRFPDENERRLFVQTLFNRLIFLRFVEEKGWMKIDGRYDYLQALWEKARDSNQPLWPTRLNALFRAVNHEIGHEAHIVAKPLIGDVVYLNGGLFDEDPRFVDPEIKIPDEVFEKLLGPEGLFYRYNFTVEESTPLDVQVAVDPEILGKIFEQLTISSKRHDTGSYYTPREIVQFMCREALVGYLTSPRPSGGEGSGVRELPEAKARALVYDHDDSTLTNQEGNLAFEALKAIKVVDPACGSGAYLLGMLQELYALFEKLRRDDRKFSDDPAKEAHERKLWIIENNIYGVDLQAFATNTAMLRLWLTLLVEDTGERPQPLPNLEYKIETGDSLLGPDPSQPIDWSKQKKGTQEGLDLWDKDKTLRDLRDLRETYQNSHADKKTKVKKDLEAKLAELREKVTGSPIKDPAKFDWRVEFFDVFLEDPKAKPPGFDVVIANPPYGLISGSAFRQTYAKHFPLLSGKPDLYRMFLERCPNLLVQSGFLAFIIPNTILAIPSAAKLRHHLMTSHTIEWIVDITAPVFGAAVNNVIVMIKVGKVAVPGGRVGVAHSLEDFSASFDNVSRLPTEKWDHNERHEWDIHLGGGVSDIIERLELDNPKLGDLTSEIVLGMQVYHNSLHTKTEMEQRVHHSNASLGPTWIPEFGGKDLKGCCLPIDRPRSFVDVSAPDIYHKPAPKYFENPRIVLREIPAKRLVAAYAKTRFAVNKSCYVITDSSRSESDLKALLAIIISAPVMFWVTKRGDKSKQALFPRITMNTIKRIPVPSDVWKHSDTLAILMDLLTYCCHFVSRAAYEDPEEGALALKRLMSLLDGLVYELYFPTEVHDAGIYLFDLMSSAQLQDILMAAAPDRIQSFINQVQVLWSGGLRIPAALDVLLTIEPVHTVERLCFGIPPEDNA